MGFSVRRFGQLVAAVAVAGLVVSGCSSSDGGSATPPGTATAGSSTAVTGGSAPGTGGVTVPTAPSTLTSAGTVPATDVPSATGSTDQGTGSAQPATSDLITTALPSTTVPATPTVVAAPAVKVSSSAFGKTDLSPSAVVTVKARAGKITKLVVTNPDGRELEGTLAKDGSSWTLGEDLGYGRTYSVSGTAVNADGVKKTITDTFTTVTPDTTVRTTVSPGDGAVVGVAMPVVVTFGVEPADRAAIEKSVSITTTPEVEGAWAWIQHDGGLWALDWRPKEYWPAGTKVHVEVNVYGKSFGGGSWGGDDLTSDFKIGRNQVTKADVNSHELKVYRDGELVASYDASYGRGTDRETTTRSGIHVINEMFEEKLMSNPRYGYTNVLEHWAVRISNNGEFIHANPGTVDSQGNTNVSHGCVNLSLEHAQEYMESSLIGDPVEITGTDVPLSAEDGDVYDWTYDWDQWQTFSAL